MTQGTSAIRNGTAAVFAAVAIVVITACLGANSNDPPPNPTPCPTLEEQSYFDSLDRLLLSIVEEIEDPYRLADEPYIGSLEASAASDRLIAAAEQMNEVKELVPPATLSTFHGNLVKAIDPMQKGATLLATGFVLEDRGLMRDGIFVSNGSVVPMSTVTASRQGWCD